MIAHVIILSSDNLDGLVFSSFHIINQYHVNILMTILYLS
jgi:hypothetical protein